MVTVATAGAVAVLGLAGCGRFDQAGAPASQQDAAQTTDLDWAGQALQAVGFDTADVAPVADVVNDSTPPPSASPSAGKGGGGAGAGARRRHRLLRLAFGKGALHGEAVVKTEDGTKTVAVQRGTVTAIDATSVTVKSSDGFSMTWTFGSPITVIERRSQVQPSAIAVGTAVGIAGDKSGSTASARLIVVPKKP
jgi:hypothetical protein